MLLLLGELLDLFPFVASPSAGREDTGMFVGIGVCRLSYHCRYDRGLDVCYGKDTETENILGTSNRPTINRLSLIFLSSLSLLWLAVESPWRYRL